MIVAENSNPKCFLHIESNCQNSKNVLSSRNSLKTIDSIQPSHRQVLMVLTHSKASSSFSIKYGIKYRLSTERELSTWPGLEGEKITNYPAITTLTSSLHQSREILS